MIKQIDETLPTDENKWIDDFKNRIGSEKIPEVVEISIVHMKRTHDTSYKYRNESEIKEEENLNNRKVNIVNLLKMTLWIMIALMGHEKAFNNGNLPASWFIKSMSMRKKDSR